MPLKTNLPEWITYPTEEENKICAQTFYEKYRIPGVLGCIDGTHILLVAPKEAKHLYCNRKGRFSLNVTLVSMNITAYIKLHKHIQFCRYVIMRCEFGL